MPWALDPANFKARVRHTGDTPQWEDREARVRSESGRADRGRFGADEMMGAAHQPSQTLCVTPHIHISSGRGTYPASKKLLLYI